jgi:NADH-quinone oxidoreductase subunit N
MNWGLLTVELVLGGWTLLLLAADLLIPASRRSVLWLVALAGLGVCAWLLIGTPADAIGQTIGSLWVVDRFALYFKGLFLLTAAVVIVMTRHFERHLPANVGAFYLLLFTALLGMFVLSSLSDLLMLFIGLELLTFSLYIMAAYLKTDRRSLEAGMKYLILGSVSGGFLVYGISLLYGFAGGTSFDALRAALAAQPLPWSAQAGLLLVIAGLGFKIAMVPFNLWVPDVYEGAPTPVVALLSVGSKMAGVVAILRLLYGVFLPVAGLWAGVLASLSAATMLYGNLAAIPQTNIKRLLGYSSIGHAGYLLMGLSTASTAGAEAVGYYLLAYLVSNLAAFLVVIAASDAIGGESLEAYNGLSKRSPLLAATLFIALLSLAGVPPLAGFVGKLLVLLATTRSGQLWLVVIGALNVVISLYYYLMVIRRMYILPPAHPEPVTVSPLVQLVAFALIGGIVVIGTLQAPFLDHLTRTLTPAIWP